MAENLGYGWGRSPRESIASSERLLPLRVEKTGWKQPDLFVYILPEKKKGAKPYHPWTEMFPSQLR